MPERRVDAFRLARWRPLLAGVLFGLLGAVSLGIAAQGRGGTGEDFWLAVAAYVILATAVVGLWLAWRAPVLVRVGPEGLHISPGYRRPFAWDDIRTLRYAIMRSGPFSRFRILEVELAPDAEIPVLWSIRWMAAADRWFARRVGVRVPLWLLGTPAEEVIASIERFHPVERKA